MSIYHRYYKKGGVYFFTVVTHNRKPLFKSRGAIEILRNAFRYVVNRKPFIIDAIVVLPEHMHCIWRLSEEDSDFSNRWMLIKKQVSMSVMGDTNHRREKSVWQRRFWEHYIRDDEDWRRHMDYIHYNPVKHGYVQKPSQWEYSSFQKSVEAGLYDKEWGADEPQTIRGMDCE